ncbi:MAG: cytochrome c [Hyphomonadaceae bacterium]
MLRFAAAAAFMGLAACAAPAPQPEPVPVSVSAEEADAAQRREDGRAIAEAQCASCHAVGEYGDSPNPAAPAFRTVLSRYRADVLEEELINGIQVVHPMPEFQLNPQGVDELIAYLESIQEAPAE